jgi:hypothetical protein
MQTNSLANLSLQQLKQAIAIREKIEDLETQLGQLLGGESRPATAPGMKRGRRKMSAAAKARISAAMKARWEKKTGKKRVPRLAKAKVKGRYPGAPLKEQIVQSLQLAGKSGMTVKEVAAKLGKSYGSISVWFHTTGKAVKEIKKVAPGKFAWVS